MSENSNVAIRVGLELESGGAASSTMPIMAEGRTESTRRTLRIGRSLPGVLCSSRSRRAAVALEQPTSRGP